MRLIDANELKEWVESWFEMNKYYHPYSKSNNIPITELYDILEHMPTIEAEPIKHGKWEHGREVSREFVGRELVSIDYEDYHCSVCGEKYKNRNTIITFKYCPHCGALMEAENDSAEEC